MYTDQQEFDICCEWGYQGIVHLAPHSDALVILDVLSFSTSVDIAVHNGALVYPYQRHDDTALAYAQSQQALLASFERKSKSGYTLSPTSLLNIPAGTRLVLPSPNGSALSLASGSVPTFAACLRNAQAIARAVSKVGTRISLIPAGEKWKDGTLRPAIEDWIAAGAVISQLTGSRSPEAHLAEMAFLTVHSELATYLAQCSSAKELIGKGFARDVDLAFALDVSDTAPILIDRAYQVLDR
jgi:2-phosphosulfolactate phosphatase